MFIRARKIARKIEYRTQVFVRRLLGDHAGNASLEFAFVVSVLIFLGIGMYDFGRYGLLHTRAHSAARAGAQFGIQNQGAAIDINGMIQAARNDASDTNNALTVSAERFGMCPDSSAEIATTGVCADGGYVPIFVRVTVQDSLDLFFDYPGIAATLPISTRSEMRVR